MATSAAKKTDSEKSNVESIESKLKESKLASKVTKSVSMASSMAKFGWHAWLGAVLTLEEKAVATASDLSKKGTSLAGELAKKGLEFEDKKVGELKSKMAKTKDQVSEKTVGVREKANTKITGVETMIDKSVNRSLHLLGVPTKRDVRELTSLMKDMSDAINELAEAAPPKAKRTTKAATADVN
ncbi:phasin family protein [Aurantivibrio plasticivorans]